MVTLPPTAACVQASLGTIAFWLTFASSNRQLRDTRECKLHSQVVRGLLLRTQQSQALQTNCVVCLRGLFVLGRIHSFPFLPLAVCMLTPRRKYDLSCSDIVYRHKTPSKKTTETRPDSGLSRPSENDTSLMLPQTFHCPESGQRSRPGFRLRNQARFESTPATVANHMGCKAVSQSHKTDTWLNQNTTFANNEIQTNTHTRQQTRTDANRQSNRHSLSIANNDRHPKDLSTTQTWADNIQSDA